MSSDKKRNEKRGIELPPGEGMPEEIGKSWFLGIGINDYQHFPPLNNAVRDVEAILKLLREQYDIDEAKILTDGQATRRSILRKLEELSRKVKPDDKLLIYFSGHGYLSPGGLGFWVPVEAEAGYSDDYIPNSRLRDYLIEIRSRHILLVSDACFSGALFAKGPTRRLPEAEEILEKKTSRYGFCSGRSNEEVYDGPQGGHSPFAGSILEALQENTAPRLRVSLLAEQVMSRTASQYRQLPHHGALFDVGDKGGQYVFHLRQATPAWQNVWDAIERLPEDNIGQLNTKILRLDEYAEQFPSATNVSQALALGEQLEYKREFLQAGDSLFRLRNFTSKDTPFRQQALERIEELKKGYTEPAEPEPGPRAEQPKKEPGQEKHSQPQPKPKPESPSNTFTDPRDGQVYHTIELNGQRWMAQNLNYDVGEGCWVYEKSSGFLGLGAKKKEEGYGRLYTWEAAKKACPPGWRLPTDEEWRALAMAHGGLWDGNHQGDPKKAYSALIEGGNSGFAALLGGWWYPHDGVNYSGLGANGYYWSRTEKDVQDAWRYYFSSLDGELYRGYGDKSFGYSCRCLQGAPSNGID